VIHHYRDKDQDEVDIVVENPEGALIGIEVKAAATVHAADFRGLRKLADVCGT
jgi:predicted AAA+ superfamily ATPase